MLPNGHYIQLGLLPVEKLEHWGLSQKHLLVKIRKLGLERRLSH